MGALKGGEVGLGGVVLVELLLDVVVDGGEVFLQGVDEFGEGLVGAVFDFVPVEGLEVVLYGSCRPTMSALRLRVSKPSGPSYCH